MTIRYGSVCSGIEAATAAWHPLGWEPAWFCEIDPFPSAVLAHHHPEVPNHGDFTQLLDPAHPARHGAPLDVLVGGTPCQSFSQAGGRAGLDDPRGQLMLRYLDLVGALRPRWVVWENVPGVLSSGGGRDFGALLGGLADLGYGVAYRVLDARYFGVPQRRRRVFVVGHSGGDPERAARVLALDEGVRGHLAARGNSRKEAAAAVGRGAAVGGEQVTSFTANMGGNDGGVYADGTVATLRVEAQPAVAWGILSDALDRSGESAEPIAVAGTITAFMAKMGGNHGSGYSDGTTPCLRAQGRVALTTGCVGFQSNLGSHGGGAYEDESVTLKAVAGGRGNPAAVAFKSSHYTRGKDGAPAEVTPPLSADADKGGQDTLVLQPVSFKACGGPNHSVAVSAYAPSLDTQTGNKMVNVQQGSVVRRLTPRECERLQGFPDDHTLIPYRGKPATDGHRYKALGNSMAVPVMRWIGERLEEEDARG